MDMQLDHFDKVGSVDSRSGMKLLVVWSLC